MTTVLRHGPHQINLMPCPFCYNDPEVDQDIRTREYVVACTYCNYSRRFSYHEFDGDAVVQGWNDRHPRSRVIGLNTAFIPEDGSPPEMHVEVEITQQDLRLMWQLMDPRPGDYSNQYIAWSFGYGAGAYRCQFSREDLVAIGQMMEGSETHSRIRWRHPMRRDTRAGQRVQTDAQLQNREDRFAEFERRVAARTERQRRSMTELPDAVEQAVNSLVESEDRRMLEGTSPVQNPPGLLPTGPAEAALIRQEQRAESFLQRFRRMVSPSRPEQGSEPHSIPQEASNPPPRLRTTETGRTTTRPVTGADFPAMAPTPGVVTGVDLASEPDRVMVALHTAGREIGVRQEIAAAGVEALRDSLNRELVQMAAPSIRRRIMQSGELSIGNPDGSTTRLGTVGSIEIDFTPDKAIAPAPKRKVEAGKRHVRIRKPEVEDGQDQGDVPEG